MSARSRIAADVTMFLALLAVNAPGRTGMAVHEWLALALAGAFMLHLALNARRGTAQAAAYFDRLRTGARLGLAVDAALLVSSTVAMVSGLAQSQVLAPAVGVATVTGGIWGALHLWSAWTSIALAMVHFGFHWRWVSAAVRSPARRRRSTAAGRRLSGRSRPGLGVGSLAATATATLLLAASIYGGVSAAQAVARSATPDNATVVASTAVVATNSSSSSVGVTSRTAAASAASSLQTCPRTGCTSSSCHNGR